MALPHHQFQHHPQQQQQQQSKSFRNLYAVDSQIAPPVAYFNASNFPDQSHPQYIPPFHVVGIAPDGSDGGIDFQWNNGLESKKRRCKEQDFLEINNSQISSVDFLQGRSVSTGLGLSLDNNSRAASSVDSPFLSLIADDIDQELQRQDLEIDRFLKIQSDRMKQAILEKFQANQLQTVSCVEEKVLEKLREKEEEVENINKKNMELEERINQLSTEAIAWQDRAKYNESVIATLKFNIQQVYAANRDSKEGCGDNGEVDDTASCCNGRGIDFQVLSKESSSSSNDRKELMRCKVCRVNQVCVLLLPCNHLCLCKDCEINLKRCPLCQAPKYLGMEVFI